MTKLELLPSGARWIAEKAAKLKLQHVTRLAVKRLKEKGEEVTLENVLKNFDGLDRLQEEAGFAPDWIKKIINKEMEKCI